MEEYRDDKKSKLYYMDEILHKISYMSQAENEKQLDDITLSILKSVGKYTAADRAYIFEWSSEKKESFKNTFEWCASGIEPQIQNLQKVPVCLIQIRVIQSNEAYKFMICINRHSNQSMNILRL